MRKFGEIENVEVGEHPAYENSKKTISFDGELYENSTKTIFFDGERYVPFLSFKPFKGALSGLTNILTTENPLK